MRHITITIEDADLVPQTDSLRGRIVKVLPECTISECVNAIKSGLCTLEMKLPVEFYERNCIPLLREAKEIVKIVMQKKLARPWTSRVHVAALCHHCWFVIGVAGEGTVVMVFAWGSGHSGAEGPQARG